MLDTARNSGLAFALMSLMFAGVLDVIYKRYSSEARSRGMYLMGMGLTFCMLQLATALVVGEALTFDTPTLAYGLAAGALVTASNILLIESFTHLDVSLGSTIYRLNTIGVVAFSWLFLAETLHGIKLTGIAFGVAAALLLYRHHAQKEGGRAVLVFFWIAVLASVLRAGFGVFSKAGINAGGQAASMMTIAAACWIVGGLGYAVFREANVRVGARLLGWCLVSGTVVFLVINTLFAALARAQASVVIPIANLSFVVALLISVSLRMEVLSWRKLLALAFAALAIVLLSQDSL